MIIYSVQRNDKKWHEVMVDMDADGKLQFVQSRGPTFNSTAFLQVIILMYIKFLFGRNIPNFTGFRLQW